MVLNPFVIFVIKIILKRLYMHPVVQYIQILMMANIVKHQQNSSQNQNMVNQNF